MVASSKSLACWVTAGPLSGLCGLWTTVRLVTGEEGVGRVGRVVPLDDEGQR